MMRYISRQLLLVVLMLLIAVSICMAGESRNSATSAPKRTALGQEAMPPVGTTSDRLAPPAGPIDKAAEQINWHVISSGGNMDGSSTNFRLSGTVGQTAVGVSTYGNNQVHHGFWQRFGCCDKAGDANDDGGVNVGDMVYVLNYIFRSMSCATTPPVGCPPECESEGDANADGGINVGDAVYLGNFIFQPLKCATNPPVGCPPVCGPGK